jgi:hypothetical protein
MPTPIVSRTAWGARNPTRITPLNTPVRRLIVHHGASPAGRSATDERALIRSYQSLHMDTRGWTDIAYNILIGQSGTAYEGRGPDRQGGATGSPWDAESISICLVGNFQTDIPTPELVDTLVAVIRDLIDSGHLTVDVEITGHIDHFSTACPGSNVVALLPEIRRRVFATIEEPVEMLTPEFLADGWKRYPDDAGAVAFVRASLQALGYKPGGDRLDQAIISFKRKSDRLTADEPDATVRGPFWRELVRQVAGIELPSPADPNPALIAERDELAGRITLAAAHLQRAKNALIP